MTSNKYLTSAKVLRKLTQLSAPTPNTTYLINRNPRNLEQMRIAYRPAGYHLDKPGKSFWNKLVISKSGQGTTAQVVHFENGVILQASTNDWAIKKHLYKTNDSSAYVNLARVLAQRCLEAGILEVECQLDATPNGKLEKFLQILQSNGVALKESERYIHRHPHEMTRMEKPWEAIIE